MKVNSLIASKCWGVREEYIIPGNGAAELINVLMELLPGTLGITRPTFEEYPNRRDKASLVTFIPNLCMKVVMGMSRISSIFILSLSVND
jgi:hypothetical protein